MAEISLEAKKRTKSTKGALNQLRKSSNIPGVYYGIGIEPTNIYVHENSLRPLVYTSETHLVNLIIDQNEPAKCILKNVQFDPVTDKVIHFDLLGITADHDLTIEVPVVLSGSAIGVKNGGVVEIHLHKITISCLPKDIPDHISIDISDLDVGKSITTGDLNLQNIKVLHGSDVQIVSVNIPRAHHVEGSVLPGEERAEPELIGKKKAEEEE